MIVGNQKRRKSSTSSSYKATKETEQQKKEENCEELIKDYINNRDFSGVSTYLDFLSEELKLDLSKELMLWKGYSLFHMGLYSQAYDVYEKMFMNDQTDGYLSLYMASCRYYMGEYEKARELAENGPNCDYKTRLMFHISHRLDDNEALLEAHSQLVGTLENQLSLAAIHYLRCNYNEAIDVFQQLLQNNPEYIALNVYIAMCQFKLEQYEISNEYVDKYLTVISDSAIGLNLKSCDYFMLFAPENAESQILQIKKFSSANYSYVDALISHNLCVFSGGANCFNVFSSLVDSIKEARFNLIVSYMRNNNPIEASKLLENFVPADVNEHLLKAASLLASGQESADRAQIDEANQIYSSVGEMDDIKDTVIGRQALATSKFIIGEYDKVIKILETIKHLQGDQDEYNYNVGMTYASMSNWNEAIYHFNMVKSDLYTHEIYYQSWLARCYINAKQPEKAWDLYISVTSTESANTLLHIISVDCFNLGLFYYSMKAFDVLSKFSVDLDIKQGLIASSVGCFRDIVSRKESPDKLIEVLSALSNEPGNEDICSIIQNYMDQNFDITMF